MDNFERRPSNPIMSAMYVSPEDVEHATREDESERPLPRTIRALKDSSNANGHRRTIIICLNGTGDHFVADNSNVVQFVSCLRKHNPEEQVIYYQSGIGTSDKGGFKDSFEATMDLVLGSGLGTHIKGAYRFLMQAYREGDKICLFGFSSGAHTVRCLAGMIHKVGLLPASNVAQLNFAFDFYRDDTELGWKMSAQFKKTFCTNANVYFVGLWDCVASVGFIPRKQPFNKTPVDSIHYLRHAMALDEHRAKFKVGHWHHEDPDVNKRSTPENMPKAELNRGSNRTGIFKIIGKTKSKAESAETYDRAHGHHNNEKGSLSIETESMSEKKAEQALMEAFFEKYDRKREAHHQVETNALEVWFRGAHADIGGGAVANEKRHRLSRIPLRWMIRQCFECDTGIVFDTTALAELGLDVHTLWPKWRPAVPPVVGPSSDLVSRYAHKEFPPLYRRSAFLRLEGEDEEDDEERELHRQLRHAYLPESTEDYFDAMAPVHDMLKISRVWWVLEALPVKMRILAKDGSGWEKKMRCNLGRYRAIRGTAPRMHWTVQRMIQEGQYDIKVRCEKGVKWEVVA